VFRYQFGTVDRFWTAVHGSTFIFGFSGPCGAFCYLGHFKKLRIIIIIIIIIVKK